MAGEQAKLCWHHCLSSASCPPPTFCVNMSSMKPVPAAKKGWGPLVYKNEPHDHQHGVWEMLNVLCPSPPTSGTCVSTQGSPHLLITVLSISSLIRTHIHILTETNPPLGHPTLCLQGDCLQWAGSGLIGSGLVENMEAVMVSGVA